MQLSRSCEEYSRNRMPAECQRSAISGANIKLQNGLWRRVT
jgi:hypothetical protein